MSLRLAGSPRTRFPVDFAAGEWREYRVPFHVQGFLARLIFDFGDAEGTAEFDWIRLCRDGRELAGWDFGGGSGAVRQQNAGGLARGGTSGR